MPGFVAEIGAKLKSNFPGGENSLVIDSFKGKNYFIERRTLRKFLNDKCFFEDENYIVVLEGVVLNKRLLQDQFKESWEKTIIQLYLKFGETFFKEFNGSFSGLFYDKKKDKWLIYTDHIGSKHIYYSKLLDRVIFATDIKNLFGYLNNNNQKYNLDITSAYLLLSYGYMLEDYTLAREIKKLMPGHYVKIEKEDFSICQYYALTNVPDTKMSEEDFIEEMDKQFRQAVSMQFEKDLEYGYKHLVALSGGLDSRMTSWVAHDLGYTNQLNCTFSQSDYLDETIPKSLSSDLKHEWIFKALDNGLFLNDIDEITKITGGNVLYYGLAHGNSLIKYLDFGNLGILHSGQLGDVVFGTFYKENNPKKSYSIGDGAHSIIYLHKIKDIQLKNEFPNQEIFNFYQRGFAGANNGLLAAQNYTETFSPFYNIELLEFALSIPVIFRFNHRIYKKWMLKKYPTAAQYKWEGIKNYITAKSITFRGKEMYINTIPHRAIRKMSNYLPIKNKYGIDTKNHMNPIDYWLKTNSDLSAFFNSYFNETIGLIKDKELNKDLKTLFETGSGKEKVQVLSLLSAVRLFFAN